MSGMNTTSRGALIVVEGLDRAGKTTQCELLYQSLCKAMGDDKVKYVKFPDRTTPIGQLINSYLSGNSHQEDHVIHLLFSANRWEAAPRIEANLQAGVTYIIDRYIYSGCVYSAAKRNPHLNLRWARQPEEGLPKPDMCAFLDVSSECAAERGGYGVERYEREDIQRTVRQLFKEIRASSDGEVFTTFDAELPPEDVHKAICEKALQVIARVKKEALPLQHIQPP